MRKQSTVYSSPPVETSPFVLPLCLAVVVLCGGLLIAAWPYVPIFAVLVLAALTAGIIGAIPLGLQRLWITNKILNRDSKLLPVTEDGAAGYFDEKRGVLVEPKLATKVPKHLSLSQSNSGRSDNPLPTLPVPEIAQTIKLPEMVDFFDNAATDPFRRGELYINLGQGVDGPIVKPITKLTHFLTAGNSGSGKSTMERAIVAQPLRAEIEAPGRTRVALIDLTGITFHAELFKGLPQTYAGNVATSEQDALELLDQLLYECEYRAKLFALARGLPETLAEYNAVAPAEYQLPVIMVFIEEVSALAEGVGDAFVSPLKQLIWQARKFGIYLNNCGQDFKANVIDKSVTDNSLTRFMFGQISPKSAEVLGFNLKKHQVSTVQPGRGMLMHNGQVQEFQGLYLPKPEFVGIVNQLRANAGLSPVGITDNFAQAVNIRSTERSQGTTRPGVSPENGTGPVIKSYGKIKGGTRYSEAVEAFKVGANSKRKLMEALDCTDHEARTLIAEMRQRGVI
jgi:DNA segregation ATPase FtsK/SpoIIIE-like protein